MYPVKFGGHFTFTTLITNHLAPTYHALGDPSLNSKIAKALAAMPVDNKKNLDIEGSSIHFPTDSFDRTFAEQLVKAGVDPSGVIYRPFDEQVKTIKSVFFPDSKV